jgi:purine-cytosine permease-like protein
VAHLAGLWAGIVLNVQTLVYGALLVAFGLNAWQCVAAILIGNATWVVSGLCSLAGAAAGTTTFAVNRAALGRNGNRPIAFFNWIMQVGYEILDLVLMVLASSALLHMAGVQVGTGWKVILVLAFSVLQGLLPLLGHAAITRVLHVLAAPFAAVFIILAALTAGKLHLTDAHPATWVVFLGGIALSTSASGLGWTANAADFSRYLPARTGKVRLTLGVTLGGGIPQTLLMLLGAAVAFVTPAASNPISGLTGAYPTWFLVIFLVLLIVQMAAVNGFNLYSSGVTLQAIGVRVPRWRAVLIDCGVCIVLGMIVVFSGNFNTFLSDFLLFMIVWFAPWSAIFVTDYLVRRGRYDIKSLTQNEGGLYRRPGGVFLPGVIAQLAGMVMSAMCINTSVFVGPIATAMGGADLSVPSGFVVGGTLYYLLARTRVRAEARVPAEAQLSS